MCLYFHFFADGPGAILSWGFDKGLGLFVEEIGNNYKLVFYLRERAQPLDDNNIVQVNNIQFGQWYR